MKPGVILSCNILDIVLSITVLVFRWGNGSDQVRLLSKNREAAHSQTHKVTVSQDAAQEPHAFLQGEMQVQGRKRSSETVTRKK
jgi:hypothetical protein